MRTKLFNTYKEAVAFLGEATIGAPDLSWLQPRHRKAIIAQAKLFTIHDAHNKANGFKADWTDSNQQKFCAWHWIKADSATPSGFGFSGTHYDLWLTFTCVGARLSVGTSTEAVHIAEKFSDLYQDWYFFEKEAEISDGDMEYQDTVD